MQHLLTLEPSGRQIVCAGDESILHAARLQNVPLRYSCLNGSCGSCRALLVEGSVNYPYKPPLGLSPAEQAHGEVLLCQAVPTSDLRLKVVEVPAVAGIPIRQLAVRLTERSWLAPGILAVGLRLPRGERLDYVAGQYIDILAGARRAYSIASPPPATQIELHLKVGTAPGSFSARLAHELALGTVLRVEGPFGTFVVGPEDVERVLIAGGTGYAPLRAQLLACLAIDDRTPTTLYFGARHAAELYADAELTALTEQYDHLRYVPVVEKADGTAELLLAAVAAGSHNWARATVYMAGPPGLIAAARQRLKALGVDDPRMRYDSFDMPHDPKATAGLAK